MAAEDLISQVFLNWNSLILVIYIFGGGYIGISFLKIIAQKYNFKLSLYDSIICSILLGFVSFAFILSFVDIPLGNNQGILDYISKGGVGLFMADSVLCILFAFTTYVTMKSYFSSIELSLKKPKLKKKSPKRK